MAAQFTGFARVYAKLDDTIKRSDSICNGDADDIPEQAFLYAGGLESVREKAAKLAK
jgi:F-type H+-transporting ATPase subunit beta